jgi:PAS domain S-box-containing protein
MSDAVLIAAISSVGTVMVSWVVNYFRHRSTVTKLKAEAIKDLDERLALWSAPLMTQQQAIGEGLIKQNDQLREEQTRLLDMISVFESRIQVLEFFVEGSDRSRVMVDSRGSILKVSPGFRDMFKRTQAGCVGHTLKEFMDAESWSKHEAAFTHRDPATTAVPGCAVGNAVDGQGEVFRVSVDTSKSFMNYRTGLWTYLADISVVGDG